jgi:hypothetical protein
MSTNNKKDMEAFDDDDEYDKDFKNTKAVCMAPY